MYKRDKTFLSSIPPEWRDVPIGTLCSLDGEEVLYAGPLLNVSGKPTSAKYLSGMRIAGAPYSSLTPLEAWIPEIGENVVCWDESEGLARMLPYLGPNNADVGASYPHKVGHTIWRNIARVPEEMYAKDFPCEAAYWEANGEKFGGDDE